MRAEVEAWPETSGEGQRGQGRPSPLSRPLQQFGASSRQEAVSKLGARREKCASFVNDCKAVCILENVAGRNDEDTTTHCSAFEKVDTTTPRPL